MYRLILVISIVLFWSGPPVCVGQTRKPDSDELLKQLLALPAPTPRGTPTPTTSRPQLKQDQPDFFSRQNPPPDDAPIDDLIVYWSRWSGTHHGPQQSQTVTQRLFEYCLNKPELLSSLLQILPANETIVAKVKEIYDKEQNEQMFDSSWRDSVKEWLVFKSNHFLSELSARARKIKDSLKDGDLNRQEELVALAKLDWSNAEPLLRSLLASAQPRSSTLALSLFYRHAVAEKDLSAEEHYRRNLQQIAADRTQPGHARDTAIKALSSTEWSGRNEWYLSLFEDETLIKVSDGEYTYSPLTDLFASDPDKWIPEMARLLESKDVAVRSGAASCLMMFLFPEPRKDALLPLLPWLSNPAWLSETAGERARLISTLALSDIPESVPGLISLVENEKQEERSTRSYAAYALAKYKDRRAVPALKRALATEKDEGNRQRIIEGLVACEGLTDTEGIEALEAYLAKVRIPEFRAQMNQYSGESPFELPVSIGRHLRQMTNVPDSLVKAVVAHADILKSQNPGLAQDLLEIAHRWQGPQVELDMINRIADGSADANMIAAALTRRQTMLDKLRPELERLVAADGLAPAVGAVLLDDRVLAQSVLTSGDQPAQIALLACSRLMQTPLPVEVVGSFLPNRNKLLAQAAELYLLAEDSHEARELLWQHHPNEAFVTGWREKISEVYAGSVDVMSKLEDRLRAELFKEDGPVEIFALLSGDRQVSRVLRIYPNKAVYTHYDDPARYRERTVSKAEVSTFREYLTTSGLLELGPDVAWCHHGCESQQFLVVSKEKGRRVFSQQGFLSLPEFPGNFTQLGDGEGAKTHYEIEKEIKGLEVLFADPDWAAVCVWQHETGQLQVFVESYEEETEEPVKPDDTDDDDDEPTEEMLIEQQRKEIAASRARFSWRVFANGKLGDVASQPDVYSVIDPVKFLYSINDDEDTFATNAQLLTPNSIIVARGDEGLWKQFAGSKAVRIGTAEGAYGNPLVTNDGKWLVVGKSDTDWSDPNYIVRLNLHTGREFRVNIEPADIFSPIAFLDGLGKVLLRRARGDNASKPVGPDHPEFYLLDPATGQTRLVTGNFEPLLQAGQRFLQDADKPDECWAAIPDETKNETQVGRYNVRNFSFKPVMTVPHIIFDSMTMWIDATKGKVYVVYKGQLLRLPLQAAASK